MKAFAGTRQECDGLRATIDKALGLPRKGVRVGGGLHVLMPETWGGQGSPPPGWTATAVEIIEPTGDNLTLPPIVDLPDDVEAELAKPEARARLTAQERAAVVAALAARTERDRAEYYPRGPGAAPRAAKR